MTPFVQRMDLPPDALALARKLADRPGLALLWAADGSGPSYLACDPVAQSSALDPEPSLAIGVTQDAAWDFPRWIGVVPYEALRGIERQKWTRDPDLRSAAHLSEPLWNRYRAVARVDDGVTVLGDDAQAVAALVQRLQERARARTSATAAGLMQLRRIEQEPAALHRERIVTAQRLIVEGELYLVNLARRFCFELQAAPLDVLARFGQLAQPRFGACLQLGEVAVVSSSPELFLELSPDRQMLTVPIKGTRPRSADPAADQAAKDQLGRDEKEAAELSMVIDVERNDLGRVAEVGTVAVELPPVVTACGPLWHRSATVRATLDLRYCRAELLAAMAPSGSVTGAPKIRAMELIAQLESQRRGLYTGGLGYLSHRGGLRLSMAIRTLTTRGGVAHYHAGGGIVVDSDPDREVEETEWKAKQVLALCANTL